MARSDGGALNLIGIKTQHRYLSRDQAGSAARYSHYGRVCSQSTGVLAAIFGRQGEDNLALSAVRELMMHQRFDGFLLTCSK